MKRFSKIFVSILPRLYPILDRFIPGFVLYFLHGKIRGWKTRGLIKKYKTDIVRESKLFYKIDIRIVLTKGQVKDKIGDLIAMING